MALGVSLGYEAYVADLAFPPAVAGAVTRKARLSLYTYVGPVTVKRDRRTWLAARAGRRPHLYR